MKIKTSSYYICAIAILLVLIPARLVAQSPFDPAENSQAGQIREELRVFTDRSIYAAEEGIRFFADHRVTGLNGDYPWSSVLYVELVASTGQPLAQGKFRLLDGKAEGILMIPGSALTGNYYLKSYTRWMRNAGPGSFSYIPLKIINPQRSDVIGPAVYAHADAGIRKLVYTEGMLECSTSSRSLKRDQEATVQLKAASGLFPGQFIYCVTVVPEGSVDLRSGQYENTPPPVNDSFSVSFLPDLGDGVSISGTVVGRDLEPVALTTLHFSRLGDDPDYFAVMPDKYGKFVLKLQDGSAPTSEFYITPGQEDGNALEVRIDQEYDSRQISFPAEPFRLSGEESETARKIALNVQLSKAFKQDRLTQGKVIPDEDKGEAGIPFYGSGVKQLFIDDYVRLPNLEEIFINLVPEVQTYRQKGNKKIRIISENKSIGVYNPLIMIDNISVFDHEAVLSLSPEKISRIDLIDDIYLKGSVPFGGVLSIYSRKGDMAGIDLPPGSYFFDYQFFSPEIVAGETQAGEGDRVPDSRNTYLWMSNQLLEQGGQVDIPFRAPGTPGNFVVLVRGVSPEGKIYSASTAFSVE